MIFNLNHAVPLIQLITYVLLIINLPAWICLGKIHKFDRDLIGGILLVIGHATIFYTCIIFFNWQFFQFTQWSQWLRFQTWATALLIAVAMIWRKRRIEKAHG